jgi:hypothetical protein
VPSRSSRSSREPTDCPPPRSYPHAHAPLSSRRREQSPPNATPVNPGPGPALPLAVAPSWPGRSLLTVPATGGVTAGSAGESRGTGVDASARQPRRNEWASGSVNWTNSPRDVCRLSSRMLSVFSDPPFAPANAR